MVSQEIIVQKVRNKASVAVTTSAARCDVGAEFRSAVFLYNDDGSADDVLIEFVDADQPAETVQALRIAAGQGVVIKGSNQNGLAFYAMCPSSTATLHVTETS